MPLVVIMTAANTVSRASEAVSGPPEIIRVTIRPTSITVTATASTSDPNGSPTRWAITSAWCTAASTAAPSRIPTTATRAYGRSRPQVAASASTARTGAMTVQRTRDRITRSSLRPARLRTTAGPAAASRGHEEAAC